MFPTSTVLDSPFETNGSPVAEQFHRRSTLLYLVSLSYEKLFNTRLRLAHHCGDTSFYDLPSGEKVTSEQAEQVASYIKTLIQSKKTITFKKVEKNELVEYLMNIDRKDKAEVANRMRYGTIIVAILDDYFDYIFEPMKSNLSELGDYVIKASDDGFLTLQVAGPLNNTVKDGLCSLECHKWSVRARKEWEKRGVSNLLELNKFIVDRNFAEVRQISESMNQHSLDEIEKRIISNYPERRVISIAGPSSSGKTTISEPIKKRLEAKGFKCAIITTDDYFVDRSTMIPNAQGKLEFESINAVHTDLLGKRIETLLEGGEVPYRTFDFHSGTGNDQKETFSIGEKGFVIVEGIHGVNPQLLCHLGKAKPQTIYVAPMTPISIDNEHVISSGDICLARRIVRDNEERGYSPRLNVMWWNDVREGEEQNITPFVKDAEMLFDSSFCYELPMMQPVACEILKQALTPGKDETENDSKFRNGEIQRFLKLFSIVDPLVLQRIPSSPGLQEFLGSSLNKQ